MNKRRNWVRNELLIALKVYCELEFGQLHSRHPRIIEVSSLLNRTPGSLAMKLCNFSSLDPSKGGKGLKGASKKDLEIITEFLSSPEKIIVESEAAFGEIVKNFDNRVLDQETDESSLYKYDEFQDTERISTIKTRTIQHFFRKAVISSYHSRCAICCLDNSKLLVASHIIPWSVKIESRADPRNGISLCSLHDSAFDLGLITIDKKFKIHISSQIKKNEIRVYEDMFYRFEEQLINTPFRFTPNEENLLWHNQHVFQP